MPLYVRDDDVDALANELQKLTRARTKTEVVRMALQHELARARKSLPAGGRFAEIHALADAVGEDDPHFDMKIFTDEMWEN